jgi:hypothetical protein
MKKYSIVLIIIVFCVLLNCCSFKTGKGTAKWWASNSSEESKERGVFVSYYEALPFEYEDSIFHMKLVFKEVYTEWFHWFEWNDTALKNCMFWKNSKTLKDQQLIGIYDSSCVLGITLYNDSNHIKNERYANNDSILKYADIPRIIMNIEERKKCYRGGWHPVSFMGNELYFKYYWESVCGVIPVFYMSRYYYVWQTTGLNAAGGEFGDTIRVPIYSGYSYDKICGNKQKIKFGELVFVRKK